MCCDPTKGLINTQFEAKLAQGCQHGTQCVDRERVAQHRRLAILLADDRRPARAHHRQRLRERVQLGLIERCGRRSRQ
jgi:hypothetical protein